MNAQLSLTSEVQALTLPERQASIPPMKRVGVKDSVCPQRISLDFSSARISQRQIPDV